MRRRKKNDKRVLKPRYTSPPPQTKRMGMNKHRKPRKSSRTTLFVIVLVLVAFVIGAGIGVSMALGGSEDDGPHVENVTVEMTNNLTKNHTDFDYDMDYIDYNNISDREEYNITYNGNLNY
ncbi:hypothetical protein [Methanobrevibacter sp.]|uniref:hypothetical protein n=1 Tax=Methanobrevibacter sp. TaxID=66852 RepID=UPI003864B2E7